ncbi:hypothetical protein VTK73DRAFT_5053 [Phialemonium thermophilum]|uniref:Uncharacterized protein n=1 Tax=Phialemonium thermophilum TaxID=223376 RepID=A0ABR3V3Y2_9PEZI
MGSAALSCWGLWTRTSRRAEEWLVRNGGLSTCHWRGHGHGPPTTAHRMGSVETGQVSQAGDGGNVLRNFEQVVEGSTKENDATSTSTAAVETRRLAYL